MYCTVQSPARHLCATNTMQCISITVTYSPGCVAFSFSCARIYKTQFLHTHIQTHSSSIIQHHKKYKQTRLINKNTQYHVNATSPICLAVSALLYLVSFYRRSRLHHSSRLPYSVPQEKNPFGIAAVKHMSFDWQCHVLQQHINSNCSLVIFFLI